MSGLGDIGNAILVIVSGIIGLAILSVIVSRQSNTSGVIQAAGSGLGTVIGAAVAPVSGSTQSNFLTAPFNSGGNGFF